MAMKNRKPLTKVQKAMMQAGLKRWRDGLTDEDRAALSAQGKARWAAMSPKEQKAAMAGVKAWQGQQRAAKKAAAKAKPNGRSRKPSPVAEISESPARIGRKAPK